MTYRALGKCGTKVSCLGLGGWTTYGGSIKDDHLIKTIIRAAFDSGINFFDIADIYANGESEKVMGKALKPFQRSDYVLTTKVFFPMSPQINDRGLSRKHIMESIDKSLKRLGTDYIDIYFCHRFDPETPIEETARAMDDLIHQGKILYWGTSEWTGDQIDTVQDLCRKTNLYRPQVEQPQYSLVARKKFETDTAPATRRHGLGSVVWSPLGSGILTGKYDDGIPDGSRMAEMDWIRDLFYKQDTLAKIRTFKAIADELGCTRSQLAIAWAMKHRDVSSVILGATSKEQLVENFGALKVIVSDQIAEKLETLFPA